MAVPSMRQSRRAQMEMQHLPPNEGRLRPYRDELDAAPQQEPTQSRCTLDTFRIRWRLLPAQSRRRAGLAEPRTVGRADAGAHRLTLAPSPSAAAKPPSRGGHRDNGSTRVKGTRSTASATPRVPGDRRAEHGADTRAPVRAAETGRRDPSGRSVKGQQ